MLACHFKDCMESTGTSLLCRLHRKGLSTHNRKKFRNIWHDLIRERGRRGGSIICFHCEEPFPWGETCGDHFPRTVGSRKDLEFDIMNGQATCKSCNRSDNPNRKDPKEFT